MILLILNLIVNYALAFDASNYIQREVEKVHASHILYKETSNELWLNATKHLPYSMDEGMLYFYDSDIKDYERNDFSESKNLILNNDNLDFVFELYNLRSSRALELGEILKNNEDKIKERVLLYLADYRKDNGALYRYCNKAYSTFSQNAQSKITLIECNIFYKITSWELKQNIAGVNYCIEQIYKKIDKLQEPLTQITAAEIFIKSYYEQLDPHTRIQPDYSITENVALPYDDESIIDNYIVTKIQVDQDTLLHIKVDNFAENSSAIILNQMKKNLIKDDYPKGVILDLRNNPGGYISEAANLIRFFSDDKSLFFMEYSNGAVVTAGSKFSQMLLDFNLSWSQVILGESLLTQILYLKNKPSPYDGNLIVLINEASASAAELVAGSLQAMGRAVVVGSRNSFGKGTGYKVTETKPEEANSDDEPLNERQITELYYYFIDGSSPQLVGVKSDIVISQTPRLLLESKLYKPLPSKSPPKEILESSTPRPELKYISTLKELSRQRVAGRSLTYKEEEEEAINIMADWLKIQNP